MACMPFTASLAVWEPHQWWWPSSYGSPWDCFLSPILDERGSYERGSRRMLIYQLECFSLNVLQILYLESQKCPRECHTFYHNDGVLLHKMGVRVLLVYFGT